ncbi:MAG TPA: signal peptidase I [Gammaproteobacteria bacterium]|nr:signal peptidase I [Gammaproteobacteria bacterium]
MRHQRLTGLLGFVRQQRGLMLFILLLGVFRGAIADWSPVPTGSMNPTIVPGDVIWVNKLAYDVRVPFSEITLARLAEPQRGDIVVFRSAAADKRLVKRVICLPGDEVMLRGNRLIVNSQTADYQPLHSQLDGDFTESLPDMTHAVRFTPTHLARSANFGPVRIPQDQFLVLGDNRNNSADSRVYGFVPRREIVGRASHVLLSVHLALPPEPRFERFVTPLL